METRKLKIAVAVVIYLAGYMCGWVSWRNNWQEVEYRAMNATDMLRLCRALKSQAVDNVRREGTLVTPCEAQLPG